MNYLINYVLYNHITNDEVKMKYNIIAWLYVYLLFTVKTSKRRQPTDNYYLINTIRLIYINVLNVHKDVDSTACLGRRF